MHRGRPTKVLELLVILAVVLGARAASSAEALGTIEGSVTDGNVAIAGALVRAACPSGQHKAVADGGGRFAIRNVPPGTCNVTASMAGFQTFSMTVTVAAGSAATLNVVMTAQKKIVTDVKPSTVTVEKRVAPPKPEAMRPSNPNMSPPMRKDSRARHMANAQIAGVAPQPMVLDEPGNTEAYARIDDNPFLRSSAQPLSTFSADVDTASYSNLRRFLRDGNLPPKDAIRIEEMINYFHYDYPAPAKGEPFSITTEVGPSPWNAKHRLVRIGLKAPAIDDRQVPARNLVFLLDVSGSMNAANKLPLLKQAMGLLVETLRPQDKVAIAVYAGASGLALPSTSGGEKDTIRQAIFNLAAGGSTNGAAGIQLAYDIAAKNFIQGGINRVILATDGDFNVGVTNEGDLTRLIEQERERGVFLTVLGFGLGNLKDATMEKLANRGNGNYGYIDSIFEARKVLVKEAGATLVTVAKDVKLQIEFNPTTVAGYRLVGYENRLLRNEDFNDVGSPGTELEFAL